MGGTEIRAIFLVGAVSMCAACGSAQSPSSTTVSSGGADVPEEAIADPGSGVDTESKAVDEEEEVELSDETKASRERRERRDIKMRSYDEAMARPVEVGDATAEGGEAQLSGEEVASFMDDHLDEMYELCIEKELRRENELGTVTIDLAIRGKDGMVLGTTIDPGRRRFKKCLEDYLEDVRFPTFASPRMGARYRFHAG
ncbi:MAG: hypothetical protein WBB42_05910 [Polyangiales bacterium]